MECMTPTDYCPACGYPMGQCDGHKAAHDLIGARILKNHNEGRHGLCIDNQGIEEDNEPPGHGYCEAGDY